MTWGAVDAAQRLAAVESALDRLETEHRARELAARVAVGKVADHVEDICDSSGENAPLCQALLARQQDRMGAHSDVWVLFDAALNLNRADLSKEQRDRAARAMSDVSVTLARMGALEAVRAAADFSSDAAISSNELLRAVVAQAHVCLDPDFSIECRGGIPEASAEALDGLATFIVDNAETAPYAMSNRIDAVHSLLDSGLLRHVEPTVAPALAVIR